MPRQGWAKRQIENTRRNIAEWPEWMRREANMAGKAPAFGGGYIDFSGRKETIEEVLGKQVSSTDMIKNLWAYIKKNELQRKAK